MVSKETKHLLRWQKEWLKRSVTTSAARNSLHRFVRRWWNRLSGADRRLATGLITALSAEKLYKADCFDYLCWLEETDQRDKVKDADFLVLASDGTTCWGKNYADAVKVAMHHDKELYDAVCDLEANPPNGESSDRPSNKEKS